jgi:RNA polymerase sigma-70 factor (ECF subfamily)
MNADIATLVDRARNDALPVDEQHAAFAELVRRFEESAFGWSLQLLDDPEEARDAAQDAFLTAWLKLRRLRDPAAFGAWLKRVIATQCSRRRRRSRITEPAGEETLRAVTECHLERRERQRHLAAAISRLPEAEHRVVVLFYFLGRKIDEIAAILGMPRGTVGKRLYSARIAIRRSLPRSVRGEFLPLRPSPQFVRQVREGLFDEYVGVYRFDARPELEVRIEREGALLVGYGGGQQTVLASIGEGALVTTAFDGEGRFQRDRAGRVAGFVYYEFGARLGIAMKILRPGFTTQHAEDTGKEAIRRVSPEETPSESPPDSVASLVKTRALRTRGRA